MLIADAQPQNSTTGHLTDMDGSSGCVSSIGCAVPGDQSGETFVVDSPLPSSFEQNYPEKALNGSHLRTRVSAHHFRQETPYE
jgi:hypothetical protein